MNDDKFLRFTVFLKNSATEIDQSADEIFAEWYKEIDQIAPRLLKQVKAFGEASKDGKRIRGALVILGYTLFAKSSNPELLKIAAAFELFQTAILAHDDIIDNSPTRRGKPSLHMALGGGHYGISQAICLGDMGFFQSYKLIAESTFDDRLKIKAITFYSKSIIETGIGEMLDVDLSHNLSDVNERGVQAISRLKTAYYTFVAPMSLGAILAGADDAALDLLKVYGENTGIAFQIQDDIKDAFGTRTSLKKEIGGDIKEGKQTLMYIKAKQKANKSQSALLERYYGNAASGVKEIEAVKQIFEETGARAYAEALALQHAEKAREVIPQITDEAPMQEMLGEIIEYVMKSSSEGVKV